MKNFVQHGATMHWTNGTGSDVSSGDVVVVGNQVFIAITDIADGSSGDLSSEGVYTVPKTAGAAITQGDAAIYDVSAGAFVPSSATPATGDVSGAVTCWVAAASGDTSVAVKINTGVGSVA
ncbi:capsid cement protein [Thalassospira sp. SM2505]